MATVKKRYPILLFALAAVSLSVFVQANTHIAPEQSPVSGKIVNGLRILTVERNERQVDFTVYRGDYIKFDFDDTTIDPVLRIPDLSINETLPVDLEKSPYFKMKQTGTFTYTLGGVTGRITVIEYRQQFYREVTSQQAADLIAKSRPLILDVRTPMEFKAGRFKDSVLIPVQELRGRLKEISQFKDREILVYCATGNRSTVASKILNDKGFRHIANLRFGIDQWSKDKMPIVQ
jgi:rhodanese-related sulfurtransferase